MKKILFTVILAFTLNLMSVNDNAGTSGFAFYKVNYYAKAAAMANAYSAVTGDINFLTGFNAVLWHTVYNVRTE